MKKTLFLAASLLMLPVFADGQELVLNYDKPAAVFEEALPLGNGHLGAMVYGGVDDDLIYLNEATLWGGCANPDNAPLPEGEGPALLARVRAALNGEDWSEGERLCMGLQGKYVNSFLPMGSLHLRQTIGNGDAASAYTSYSGKTQDLVEPDTEITGYLRMLDLNTATAMTSFKVGDVTFTREYFVSHPDRVMVIHLKSSKKGALAFSLDGDSMWGGTSVRSVSENEFMVCGQVGYYQSTKWEEPFSRWRVGPDGEKGMRFQFRAKVVSCDGLVYTSPNIKVANASEAVILVSAATSYNGFDKRPDTEGRDEEALASSFIEKAGKKSVDALREAHSADFKRIFGRVSLDIGGEYDERMTVDRRLKKYAEGAEDPYLETLYFQFGRYLLASCSREDSEVPCNLQGIWCKDRHPAWGSDIHTNINIQMNYWPAEPLALSETTLPLMKFIANCAVNGRQVVRNMYGMKGWTVHHNSDIWCAANPVGEKKGSPSWANYVMAGPWLCSHLYEHYLFTGDRGFLQDEAYPLMKGSAEFLMDWLVEKDGKYITSPSTSPENAFFDDSGKRGQVTIGTAMDLEICWDLFSNAIEASEVLGVDPELRKKWSHYRDNLYPLQIGQAGNLVEWYKDWKDTDPHHRHVSHLYGLYPGRQLSPARTPALAAAARKTLEIRGDGGTGWSKAWKIAFWARLLDGDHSYKMYRELLGKSTLPNLFDTHPPFQIDGNFGSIAGIAEMFLQSHTGELHLLPALPSAWSEGSVSGLKARGGYTVDLQWKDGKLTKATLHNDTASRKTVKVRYDSKARTIRLSPGENRIWTPSL